MRYTNGNFNPQDGRVAPRSGLACKNFIDTGAGVIDADYRGEVKVLLFNFSDVDFTGTCRPSSLGVLLRSRSNSSADIAPVLTCSATTVKQGDRIAQLVLERVGHFLAGRPNKVRSLF